MTDNGSCYKAAFGRACKRLRLKHIRTKPYTPKTNGKAERFIQTALREWASDGRREPDSGLVDKFRTAQVVSMTGSRKASAAAS